MRAKLHRDTFGSVVGLLVFLGGVALLAVTFRLAYDLFSVPPGAALDIQPDKAIDLGRAGSSLVTVVVRVLLLVVMAVVGSLVSNAGIKLYSDSRGHVEHKPLDHDEDEARLVSEGGRERTRA